MLEQQTGFYNTKLSRAVRPYSLWICVFTAKVFPISGPFVDTDHQLNLWVWVKCRLVCCHPWHVMVIRRDGDDNADEMSFRQTMLRLVNGFPLFDSARQWSEILSFPIMSHDSRVSERGNRRCKLSIAVWSSATETDETEISQWWQMMNRTVMSVNLFFCQTMCFYSGLTERKSGSTGEEGVGGGTLALHAGEHVQRSLGMFRYLLKRLRMGKKGKAILYALTAAGWSKGAGPNLT